MKIVKRRAIHILWPILVVISLGVLSILLIYACTKGNDFDTPQKFLGHCTEDTELRSSETDNEYCYDDGLEIRKNLSLICNNFKKISEKEYSAIDAPQNRWATICIEANKATNRLDQGFAKMAIRDDGKMYIEHLNRHVINSYYYFIDSKQANSIIDLIVNKINVWTNDQEIALEESKEKANINNFLTTVSGYKGNDIKVQVNKNLDSYIFDDDLTLFSYLENDVTYTLVDLSPNQFITDYAIAYNYQGTELRNDGLVWEYRLSPGMEFVQIRYETYVNKNSKHTCSLYLKYSISKEAGERIYKKALELAKA